MKVYVAQLNPTVGDLNRNTEKILHHIEMAREKKVDVVICPEMAICGYPPEDLVLFPSFVQTMKKKLDQIARESKNVMVVVGLVRDNPTKKGKPLYNSAAVIIDQKIVGYKDKTLLPTYDVFDESRYFEPGEEQNVISYKGKNIAVTICEDIWGHSKSLVYTQYTKDPIQKLSDHKIDLLLNISASPYYYQKKDQRIQAFVPCAKTLNCPLIWCNQVGANDSLVFDGTSLYMDEKGAVQTVGKRFVEDVLIIDLSSKKKEKILSDHSIQDLYEALILGVKDYFVKQGFQKALIALSGGVDSALVACIAKEALGSQHILAISMPSRFSSIEGMEDARELCKNLQMPIKEVPIDSIFQKYLDLLSPMFEGLPPNTAEENLQARVRGMIVMAISNKLGHLVLSTGNKSEMALGYTTLYGDMCGGLAVLSDVSKTRVYELCRFINRNKKLIPKRILTKPPSAELKANQKDQDALPEYALLDQVLTEYVEEHLCPEEIAKKHKLSIEIVQDLVHKIHLAEYKRRQAPPGIRVTKKAFSKGRAFPIVQKWA